MRARLLLMVVVGGTLACIAYGQTPDGLSWEVPTYREPIPAPRPLDPGVLLRRIPALPATIQPAETSVAAFVGATVGGPADTPVSVTDFEDYRATFGGLAKDSPVSYAVRLFFDNGGSLAWVVRSDPAALPGVAADGTGIYALDAADPVNIICIPEISDPALLSAAEQYCSRRRAFLIIDPPASATTPAEALAWLSGAGGPPRTANCATYFPWLQVEADDGASRSCGPSGAIAGVFARVDATRGVWKAPAGRSATLRGVSGVEHELGIMDRARLNPSGINEIRVVATGAAVVWGARTLSADPEWKYVPVRRLALMIEESLDRGTRWALFEPNEEATWALIRGQAEDFLRELWRRGALQGQKAEEACFVQCGLGTTMTAGDIAAGRLNILVGFAPLKPAEFIVLPITHQVPTP